MRTICLYFEIHQIIHLKRYRFFDIGTDHYYYDDFENERSISDIANRSYMPALTTRPGEPTTQVQNSLASLSTIPT